jgi:hypothetical protein
LRPGLFYAWDDVYGGALWPHTAAGVTIDVWIVDVHGTRLFIEAETSRQADPDLEQEVQQIVGSIRFPSKPTVDHVLDLNTGVMTPLPEPIVGAEDEPSQYAVSPEGSRLAYVAPDDDGTSQIFVADLDGSRVRQMTDDPIGADWPTWSPNGATIAYEGYGPGMA